jgi:hypothetical protein
MVARWTSG